MAKVATNCVRKMQSSKKKVELDVKRCLAENNACYVLITCGKLKQDGTMQVEMTYEGDPTLAAYLVESAQNFIEPDCS